MGTRLDAGNFRVGVATDRSSANRGAIDFSPGIYAENFNMSAINPQVLKLWNALGPKWQQSARFKDLKMFQEHLESPNNPVYKENLGLCDPNHGVSDYYICSSHNTYLTGRQVGGTSSEGLYISTLMNGCRSVEIDIWDGAHGPVVSHGPTLTTSVSLELVISTVNKIAFVSSQMPVILSVEVHCRKSWQLQVKDAFVKGFGTKLVTCESEEQPNLAKLKGKVLIKIKRGPVSRAVSRAVSREPVFDGSDESDSASSASCASSTSSASSASSASALSNSSASSTASSHKIIPELCSLSSLVYGVKFRGFNSPEAKLPHHCFSFSNSKLRGMIKKSSHLEIVAHNKTHLMRIYPSGYRIGSTNFDPVVFWRYGCQMVATNWQTYDEGQQINDAMFDYGNRQGYILKPAYLRSCSDSGPFDAVEDVRFSLQILSYESKSVDDPHVQIKVIGSEKKESFKGCSKRAGEGLAVWEECKFECAVRGLVDFMFVKISVSDSREVKTFVARLIYLEEGVKYWQLRGSKGELLSDRLLVRFERV